MSAKDLLQDVIAEVADDKQRLIEEYYGLPPWEREHAIWASELREKIVNLEDALDYLDHANELLED